MTLSSGDIPNGDWRLSLDTYGVDVDGESAIVFVGTIATATGFEVVLRVDDGKTVLLKDNKAICLSALLHQALATRQTSNQQRGAQRAQA
ncbi:hypothetical protein [Amycolatopsis sp. lyj-90]|uniref:hypothetical protein n=1 Tax=Amycolatopsis sp. lyj-90 TaxID=2789285 RepID=UPI003978B055